MNQSFWPNWKEEKIYAVLVTGVLFALFLAIITNVIHTAKDSSRIGIAPVPPRTIAVTGEGKVTVSPDTASIDLGVTSTKSTEALAVTDVTTKMKTLLEKVRELGIDNKDMTTQQYSVYPRYDFPNGRQVLSGYEATQQVEVKIRDSAKLPEVLKTATESGANQVGDLRHSIDDPEPYRQEARLKAVLMAREKAEDLARAVGVRLGTIVSFQESSTDIPPIYPMYSRDAMGLGGGGAVPTPDIPTGSQDITSSVTITFELR